MPDKHQEMGYLEAKLDRIKLRRSGLPGGFVLFVVLAFLLFGDEIGGLSAGTPVFAWSVSFGSACVFGLGVNEVLARKSIRALENELALLRNTEKPNRELELESSE